MNVDEHANDRAPNLQPHYQVICEELLAAVNAGTHDAWIQRSLAAPSTFPFVKERHSSNAYSDEIFEGMLRHLAKSVTLPVQPNQWLFLWADACAEFAERWCLQQGGASKKAAKLRKQVYDGVVRGDGELLPQATTKAPLQSLPDGSFDEVLEAYQKMTSATPAPPKEQPVAPALQLQSLNWNPYKKRTVEELRTMLAESLSDSFAPHLITAELLLRDVEEKKKDPEFTSEDRDRLAYFRERWPEFTKSFPVVTKYMVLVGEYNYGAFKRMLAKVQSSAPKTMEERKRMDPKERWCEVRADYVMWLHEARQAKRCTQHELRRIRMQALQNIRREFYQFEKEYEDTEAAIRKDEQVYQKELLQDFFSVDAVKHVDDNVLDRMLDELETLSFKQAFAGCLRALREERRQIPPVCTGYGLNTASNHETELKIHSKNSRYRRMEN